MDHFHARAKRPRPARAVVAVQPQVVKRFPHHDERLDVRLVAAGLAPSRSRAQQLIAAGAVLVDGKPCRKPGRLVPAEAVVTLAEEAAARFVSRAGEKLAAALATLGWSVQGVVALDVGQSTGGFTDCLLHYGAERVVGIEVGAGQLAARLRAQALVLAASETPNAEAVARFPIITWEGVNARSLTAAELGAAFPAGGFDLIVGDLSFISAPLVWPAVLPLAAPHGRVLWLIKPQFELGPAALDKHGVVRDLAHWEPQLRTRIEQVLTALGWAPTAWFPSALAGGGVGNHPGNQEFFVAARHVEPTDSS